MTFIHYHKQQAGDFSVAAEPNSYSEGVQPSRNFSLHHVRADLKVLPLAAFFQTGLDETTMHDCIPFYLREVHSIC